MSARTTLVVRIIAEDEVEVATKETEAIVDRAVVEAVEVAEAKEETAMLVAADASRTTADLETCRMAMTALP